MANTNDPIFVFQAQTTNATTSPLYLNYANKVVVQSWGTWDGATLVLEEGIITGTNDSPTWVVITDKLNIPFEFTENATLTLTDFIYNQPIRGVITNAGGSTSLNCTLQVIIGAS